MRPWQLPGGQGHLLPIKASANAGLALPQVTHLWARGGTTAEPHGTVWLCRSSPLRKLQSGAQGHPQHTHTIKCQCGIPA